jgi:hypothetical protein
MTSPKVKTVLQIPGQADIELHPISDMTDRPMSGTSIIPAKKKTVVKKKKQPAFIPNVKFNNKQFAADILAKRGKEDLTLYAAAKATGCGKTAIWQMEAGGTPSVDYVYKVCNWLGKSVQYYFTASKK